MDRSVPPPAAIAQQVAEAREPFPELLPAAVLEEMGQQIAWLLAKHLRPLGAAFRAALMTN